jgi:cytochrome P450
MAGPTRVGMGEYVPIGPWPTRARSCALRNQVLHRNIMEAIRMHPPLLLVMRYCKKPFSVTTSTGKTYVIPKVKWAPRHFARPLLGRTGPTLCAREARRHWSWLTCVCVCVCVCLCVCVLSLPRGLVLCQGDVVAASPNFSHMLPQVFKEPTKYDPWRFAQPREEQNKPYSFIGFGAGRHACIGQNFAFLQVRAAL